MEDDVLPFHKRSRDGSIEIGTDELEAIELPVVRPPSVRPSHRPSAFLSSQPLRGVGSQASLSAPRAPMYSFSDADEMTVVRPERRSSSPPPPRFPTSMPPIPRHITPRFESEGPSSGRPAFRSDDDEPTTLLVGSSRPLLSMSSRSIIVASDSRPPPPPSRERISEPPQSSPAVDGSAAGGTSQAWVDASASGAIRDLSMTSSLSGSTDIRRMRGSPGWAVGLVAVGVFAGLVVAFVARGDGIAAAATLVDPSHAAAADVKGVATQPTLPVIAQGAVAQPQPARLSAPSCNADVVAPVALAKVDPPKPIETPKPVVVETKHEPVATYVAPRVVRHAEPTQIAPVQSPVTKPARVARRGGNDFDSASAADALAKAQLEAVLTR